MILLDGPRIAPKSGTAKKLVVLFHGYGSNGEDLAGLAQAWAPHFQDVAWASPNAPESVPGFPGGYQWFPISRLDPEVMEQGARVRAIGRLDRLPPSTRAAVDRAVAATADNRQMDLIFAISYGGRGEIVDAVRRIARDAELGKVDPATIDEKTFAAYLYAPDVPDPDLLIRTGAESRVSNFLLWQIAYSEIVTTDRMWPEFREAELEAAIAEYASRERRFGLTSAQIGTSRRLAGSPQGGR